MSVDDWRPGTTQATLVARARLLATVRAFFATRDVLEVDTPVLAATGGTEPAIECPRTVDGLVLQSSPEFFMKRLLAAGSGAIYQIARAFRAGEAGRLHNPEFLLLEWYRPGWDDAALMAEVEALMASLLPGVSARRIRFRELTRDRLGVDALTATTDALERALADHFSSAGREVDLAAVTGGDRIALLDLAYAEAAEDLEGAWFIHDFPPEQAALARLRTDPGGATVAARFELVMDGIEFANGYHELVDAGEQRRRFEVDLARRRERGQDLPRMDERLLAAMVAGLPDCSGVALGLDRVLLRQLGAASLDEVLPFGRSRI